MAASRDDEVYENAIFGGDSIGARAGMQKGAILAPRNRLLNAFLHYASGADKSPTQRFAEGMVWTDDLATAIEDGFYFYNMRKNMRAAGPHNRDELMQDRTLIGDAVIDDRFRSRDDDFFLLENQWKVIGVSDGPQIETYAIGGLSAASPSEQPWTFSPRPFFSRRVLETLSNVVNNYIENDKKTPAQKRKSLWIIWAGSNDIITTNDPSIEAAEAAIKAEIRNIRNLIKNGYKDFAVFTLAHFGDTPRYQAEKEEVRNRANEAAIYFNKRLVVEMEQLRSEFPDGKFFIHDVNNTLDKLKANPEEYGIPRENMYKPFVDSPEFHADPARAKGYAFWDWQHPNSITAYLIAADAFEDLARQGVRFAAPKFEVKSALQQIFNECIETCKAMPEPVSHLAGMWGELFGKPMPRHTLSKEAKHHFLHYVRTGEMLEAGIAPPRLPMSFETGRADEYHEFVERIQMYPYLAAATHHDYSREIARFLVLLGVLQVNPENREIETSDLINKVLTRGDRDPRARASMAF